MKNEDIGESKLRRNALYDEGKAKIKFRRSSWEKANLPLLTKSICHWTFNKAVELAPDYSNKFDLDKLGVSMTEW